MIVPKGIEIEIKSDLDITHDIDNEDIYDWLVFLDTKHRGDMVEEVKYIFDIKGEEYKKFINTLKDYLGYYCDEYNYCNKCYKKMLSRKFLEKHMDIDCHEVWHEWYCIRCD